MVSFVLILEKAMKLQTRPFDIKRRKLRATGRYCDHPYCLQTADILVTFRRLSYFGSSYGASKRLCAEHAESERSLEVRL